MEERGNSSLQRLRQAYRKHKLAHWKVISLYLVIYDLITLNFSFFFGLWIRFDLQFTKIPTEYLGPFLKFAPIYSVVCLIVFWFLHLYNSIWRFASYSELNRILVASVITVLFHIVGMSLLFGRMPISYYLVGAVMQVMFLTAARFGYRFINLERSRRRQVQKADRNVMVIGAGAAGQVILRELNNTAQIAYKACCVIDDNPNKWGRYIENVPIVGGREAIQENVSKYQIDEIMLAIPSASAADRSEILEICKETRCELKQLPGIYQLAKGEVLLNKMQAVAVEDLLGREPIQVNMEEIYSHLQGKVILVTGGGGSIGSELCRQIAAHVPRQLIILDIYENNAYEIEQELRTKYQNQLNLVVLIGSVRDNRRLNMVFSQYHPEIVFHAAAHKHVPLMETSPNEAIKNNVIGTYLTCRAALWYGAKRFVLISTDKAVNPTNIMGASKRLCEMIIQSMDHISKAERWDLLPDLQGTSRYAEAVSGQSVPAGGTQFVAVRFGNVLGSNGSVIPLFKRQIERGGPVTVTHPDIVRYFMTISEAVSLVLQAGTYARGGEIFVLDMGQPVKIDTLARNLIKLSGYKPDVDIQVKYIGLRPGEKLYEEKLMAEEGMKKTQNKLIHIGKPIPFDLERFFQQLQQLDAACAENSDRIVELVEEVVPTFHPVGMYPEAALEQGSKFPVS